MIVVRAVSTLAALSGAAVMLAGPASAEELSGMYDQYVQGSRQFTVLGTEQWPDPDTDSHWYLTLSPCGEGCTTVTLPNGRLDARDAADRRTVAVQPAQSRRGHV